MVETHETGPVMAESAVHLTDSEVQQVEEFRRTKNTAVLAVMFTDVEGSTELAETHGDLIADIVRRDHDKILISEIHKDGRGKYIKNIGDSIMAVFAEPSAAVDCALQIQHQIRHYNLDHPDGPNIAIRIGIHMGQVTVEDQVSLDVFGVHVNRACRIQSKCPPGTTYISFTVYDSALPRLVERKDMVWVYWGEFSMKGVPQPERVYEVCERQFASDETLSRAAKTGTVPGLIQGQFPSYAKWVGFTTRFPWLVLTFFYALAIFLTLFTFRLWAALSVAACGLGILGARRWWSLNILNRWLITCQVLIILVAYLGEGWHQQHRNAQMQIYVLLSFEMSHSERDQDLQQFSETYRFTLEKAFQGVSKIRVFPELFGDKQFRELSPRRSISGERRVAKLLKRANLFPDLVLRNSAELFDERAEYPAVILLTELTSLQGDEFLPTGRLIRQIGAKFDTEHLALKMTFELLLNLKSYHGLNLSQTDELRVKKNILEMYEKFLTRRESLVNESVFAKLHALRSGVVADKEVGALLTAYSSPLVETKVASMASASRSANLAKLGIN